jgi:hypothetical protein
MSSVPAISSGVSSSIKDMDTNYAQGSICGDLSPTPQACGAIKEQLGVEAVNASFSSSDGRHNKLYPHIAAREKMQLQLMEMRKLQQAETKRQLGQQREMMAEMRKGVQAMADQVRKYKEEIYGPTRIVKKNKSKASKGKVAKEDKVRKAKNNKSNKGVGKSITLTATFTLGPLNERLLTN